MNTETIIQELTHVAHKHRNDKKFTGQLIISDMCNDVIKKLEVLTEYEAIGTPDECRAAVEKQRAKKRIIPSDKAIRVSCRICPTCKKTIHVQWDFCAYCGQALSWE